MQLTLLDQLLWAATFAGDLLLVFVLYYRHRMRRFRMFTALIALDVARTITLAMLEQGGTRATYFYTYWSLALVDVLLQICVLYGIAAEVFRPTGRWARDTIGGLVCVVCGSIAIAALLTSIAHPAVILPLQSVLLKGNFFSALLLSELSVGTLALSVRGGLSWTAHLARIMQGFVVYWLCTLALEAARTYFGVSQGSHAYSNLSHVRIIVYILCTAYWIITLWKNEPASREMTGSMRGQVSVIRQAVAARIEAHQRTEAKL